MDFGSSSHLTTKSNLARGTKGYQAPEVLSGKYYSVKKADIFALGVVFFNIMFHTYPEHDII